MLDGNGLDTGITPQAFEPLLTAMSGAPDTTKGQLDATPGTVVIDKYLAAADTLGQPQLPTPITGPNPGAKAEVSGIGQPYGFRLISKCLHRQHRTKQLFLEYVMASGNIRQYLRYHEMTASGGTCRQFTFCRHADAILDGSCQASFQLRLLTGIDQWTTVSISLTCITTQR